MAGSMTVESATTTLKTVSDWAQVKDVWSDLVQSAPDASFFVTSDWVQAWVDTFASSLHVDILLFQTSAMVVAACLLVCRKYYYGPLPVKRAYFNTAGEKEGTPYIEFNTFVCRPGCEGVAARALRNHMDAVPWDDMQLDGFCSGDPLNALKDAFSGFEVDANRTKNYYIDLAELRRNRMSYEAALGSKTRYRLRQNYKMYGDIVTEVADTRESAGRFLDELAELHQKHWQRLGQPGAFASPAFRRFHERLIDLTFDSGAIQLLRFSANGQVIGLMYNFIHRGKLYFYQSGLAYSDNKRVRPGFVCIGKAIQYCLEHTNLEEFHLMPGGDHYKQHMGTRENEIEWVWFRKRSLRNGVIRTLRQLKHKLGRSSHAESAVSDAD